jgi:hypothetical protein
VTQAHPEVEGITAFEYALWAKDFKMIEMMASCIPPTKEGNQIRAGLVEQCKQVTAAIHAGGGLTYTMTYQRPRVDALGIPTKDNAGKWETDTVTEKHTENHFNMSPLIDAYQDFSNKFDVRNFDQVEARWVR